MIGGGAELISKQQENEIKRSIKRYFTPVLVEKTTNKAGPKQTHKYAAGIELT
jgi:hypothetical protein